MVPGRPQSWGLLVFEVTASTKYDLIRVSKFPAASGIYTLLAISLSPDFYLGTTSHYRYRHVHIFPFSPRFE